MDSPIVKMLKEYSERDILRLHMPGHKGTLDKHDITEVPGADSLFDPMGVIKASEENAGTIFGADSFYSTEGSSLPIRAMIYLTTLYAKSLGKEPLILAARNCHKSFISALALTGTTVKWMIPQNGASYLSCPLSAEEVEKEIEKSKPTAVYLTSPDYLGGMSDVEGISRVCRRLGVLLLVDNAHGAYLKFLNRSRHPMDLGADMCCDSAHKTLRVLGGGAYLHIAKNAPKVFKEHAKEAMSLFASTSPSYLILESLDRVNSELCDDYPRVLSSFVDKISAFNKKIALLGYTNISSEPLKITIDTRGFGYCGDELAKLLSESGVVCEFYDRDYLVMMLSPYMTDEELERLYSALKAIPKREIIKKQLHSYSLPRVDITPREATLSLSERLKVEECIGRTLASVTVGCPPAVPIIVSGEVIDEDTVKVAKYYGIEEFSVVV